MRHLFTRLRREDDGFSLIELLTAMAIGSVVLTALMTFFIHGVRATTDIQNRVDDAGRARYAMDRIVRLLDSQTCLQPSATADTLTAPVQPNSDSNSITFYGDLNGGSGSVVGGTAPDNYIPARYTITYVPGPGSTPGKVTVDTYKYNVATKVWVKQGATDTVVSDITPFKDPKTGVTQPFFAYYPFYTATTVPQGATAGDIAASPAAVPITAATAPTVVKVVVSFGAISTTSHRDDKTRALVTGSGTLSTFNADPIAPSACP
jgi:prepilin-type N-terminal cleavage/methylation domain-containing protein